MKNVPYKSALAAAALIAAPAAWAYDISVATPDITLYFTGAQGLDTGIPAAVCLSNANLDYYGVDETGTPTTSGAPSGQNYWAVFCDSAQVAGKKLLLVKRRLNGSVMSVYPQTTTTTWTSSLSGYAGLSFPGIPANGTTTTLPVRNLLVSQYLPAGVTTPSNPSNLNCVNFPFTEKGITYKFRCLLPQQQLPFIPQDAGFSDVDPYQFTGNNIPDATTPYPNGPEIAIKNADPSAIASQLTVKAQEMKIMGIPVTYTLRNALQVVQFDKTSPCNPNNTAYNTQVTVNGITTTNGESLACMPSLSQRQITSLFTGTIIDWTQVTATAYNGGTAIANPNGDFVSAVTGAGSAVVAPGAAGLPDTAVYICERDKGVGTQVSFNVKILHYPCNGTASQNLVTPVTNPGTVFLNESFDNMDSCMDALNKGTAPTGSGYPGHPVWALGINSLDKNTPKLIGGAYIPGPNGYDSAQTASSWKFGYRYIKIDGVEPTIQRIWDGSYPFGEEFTFQWNKNTLTDLNKLAIVKALSSKTALTASIAARNTAVIHSFGQGAFVAMTVADVSAVSATPNVSSWAYSPVPNALDPNLGVFNPVTPYTHTSGGTTNNCRVPTVDPNTLPGFPTIGAGGATFGQ